jgi:hypothetical protein
VSAACTSFRRALERALEGRASEDVRVLSWHEHLLGCTDCRALLEAEEALEELLGSLPEPRLPAALARRVLARLRADRVEERALDRLLGLDEAAPPPDLARRVLAGLGRGADPLDRLLERWTVAPPPDLARHVLAGVAARLARSPRRLVLARRALLALAAGLLAVLGGTVVWRALEARAPDEELARGSPAPRAEAPDELPSDPPAELLANLDLFVEWGQLVEADVELLLGTLDPDEVLLLELAAEVPLDVPAAAPEGGGEGDGG